MRALRLPGVVQGREEGGQAEDVMTTNGASSGYDKRLGKVDDGSAITDFDEEEIERRISLQTSLAYAEWKNKKINLIDTPGYAAFVADAKIAIRAAEAGLMVVDATSGVQVITERLEEVPKDRDVVVHCMVAPRARMAEKALMMVGHERVFHLEGGFRAWSEAGLSVDR